MSRQVSAKPYVSLACESRPSAASVSMTTTAFARDDRLDGIPATAAATVIR